jgi:asparagine synthase (glutamine-hydrolysing)
VDPAVSHCTLAAVYDPRATLSRDEVGRRLRSALGPGAGVPAVRGPLTVATGALTNGGAAGLRLDGDLLVAGEGQYQVDLRGPAEDWPAALARARGGFALIAWRHDRGVIARDHLGRSPLFAKRDGDVLYAASEVAPLLALLSRRPEPDLEALAMFVSGLPLTGGRTLYAGVRAVAPAHALLLDGSRARCARYWRPHPRAGLRDLGAADAADRLENELVAAVRRHGGERTDVGVLLSGGLDSSAVMAGAASLAREAGRPPPRAFTAVFPERPELDERAASRAVIEHWGAPWTQVPLIRPSAASEAQAYLERWQLPLEHPGFAFFQPLLAEAARHGAWVVLDGEGGDELFGCEPLLIADELRRGDLVAAMRLAHALPGHGRRVSARYAEALLRRVVVPGLVSPRSIGRLRRLRRRDRPGSTWLRTGATESLQANGEGSWWDAGRPRWQAHLAWVLSEGRAEIAVHDHLRRNARPTGVIDAHPLLDVDLVETVLGLPPRLAFDRRLDRALLRRATVGLLPDAVRLRRGKVYFDVLLIDALTGPDRAAVDRMLDSGALELEVIGEPARLRALWRVGPDRHPRGWRTWAREVWRAYAAESWLRREARRSD